jgi:hypothetical protein
LAYDGHIEHEGAAAPEEVSMVQIDEYEMAQYTKKDAYGKLSCTKAIASSGRPCIDGEVRIEAT